MKSIILCAADICEGTLLTIVSRWAKSWLDNPSSANYGARTLAKICQVSQISRPWAHAAATITHYCIQLPSTIHFAIHSIFWRYKLPILPDGLHLDQVCIVHSKSFFNHTWFGRHITITFLSRGNGFLKNLLKCLEWKIMVGNSAQISISHPALRQNTPLSKRSTWPQDKYLIFVYFYPGSSLSKALNSVLFFYKTAKRFWSNLSPYLALASFHFD